MLDHKSQIRAVFAAASVLAIGLAIPLTAAFATTETEHQATETSHDFNPCTGEPGTLTVTYNEVDHISSGNNGGDHGTFTQTGTFTFEQDNGLTYTGHFTVWGGFNSNSGGTEADTFTLSLHATGSDGSTLRANLVSHETINPADIITSQFDKANCR